MYSTPSAPDLALEITHVPRPEDLDVLRRGLSDHAREFLSSPGFQPVAIFSRSANGELLGGISGALNWRWLSISLLWVDPEERGSGLGGRLLTSLEDAARSKGCEESQVDTLGFQAPRFYLANGYREFARLESFAGDSPRIYFRKTLEGLDR